MSVINQNEIIAFLRKSGVLSEEELLNLHTARNEVILSALIEKRAILPSEEELARGILKDLTLSSNSIKRAKAQISFLNLVTQNMNKRINLAGKKLKDQKDRITGERFPAIKPGLVKSEG